jgi:hypothetical protein
MNHDRLVNLERLIGLVSLRRHRWLVVLALLAAIMGLGLVLGSVLRAYGQSHYDYLTSAATLRAGDFTSRSLTNMRS